MTSYFLQWNHPAEGNPHGPDFPVRDHDRGAEACKSLVSGKASSYQDDFFLHRKAIHTMRPRVMTVVDMMVLPLVVAIEIAAVQTINRLSYRSWWFTIVQVPFVTIEVAILIKIGLELWRTRKCPPFLFGFGAFGVGAIVAIWFVFFDIHH